MENNIYISCQGELGSCSKQSKCADSAYEESCEFLSGPSWLSVCHMTRPQCLLRQKENRRRMACSREPV